MRSCEGTGKNIEQAIQNALFELKAAREDVDIKILSEGGFLKKAKVVVTISEEAKDKYEKREKAKDTAAKTTPTDPDFAETFIKQKIKNTAESKPVAEEKKPESVKKEHKVKIITDEEYITAKTDPRSEENERRERKLTGEDFLNGILKALNIEGKIEKTEDDRFVKFNLSGEGLNDLIGHHGECMMSLSYLMSLVCKTENRKRVVLDIENYRIKREESLTALAKRIASKVIKTGRFYKLEPMDASERKIIHTALQDEDRVTTLSKGEEPNRYLIVFPKEYKN